jgi:APA family basic amino acid/polyamine antiporter
MNDRPALVRGLGLTAAASVNIANMIGTGVFLKARVMTCNVGDPGMVLLVWVAAGLLAMAGALTYAELATMMPRTGGAYVFLREARWDFSTAGPSSASRGRARRPRWPWAAEFS